MRVEIYTKPECSLCDEARELFENAQDAQGFELVFHNILTNDAWFQAHRYHVPVVFIDGRRALELRFTEAEVKAALKVARP